MHPIYVLLDTSDGNSMIVEAASKWIWELNSPISPGDNSKIISVNLTYNYKAKERLYAAHVQQYAPQGMAFEGLFETWDEALNVSSHDGRILQLTAKRTGNLVLFKRLLE